MSAGGLRAGTAELDVSAVDRFDSSSDDADAIAYTYSEGTFGTEDGAQPYGASRSYSFDRVARPVAADRRGPAGARPGAATAAPVPAASSWRAWPCLAVSFGGDGR